MRLLLTFSAVLFSIDGAELIQLVTVIIFAVALFIHQTKEVKQ
jgi:hypothetical protein